MKKLLVGLLALGSIAAYSSSACTYKVDGSSSLKRGRLIQSEEDYGLIRRDQKHTKKSIKIIDSVLKSKGYKKSSQDSADYSVRFRTIIHVGKFNGLENELFGDNDASVSIKRFQDNKLIYKDDITGTSGVIGSIGKRAKSSALLKKVLENVPECSQL